MVQWLKLCASSTGDVGLILGWGAKILNAAWRSQKQSLFLQQEGNVDADTDGGEWPRDGRGGDEREAAASQDGRPARGSRESRDSIFTRASAGVRPC